MLIDIHSLPINKKVTGIIHVGAHECEERSAYASCFNLQDSDVIWIEAQPDKIVMMQNAIPTIRIYQACISNEDGNTVSFMITNNGQSSSMLNFKTHAQEHPWVVESQRISLTTSKLDTFYDTHLAHEGKKYNFLNLDIQGAELMALKGAVKVLTQVDYIYAEVNTAELYENCGLINEIDDFLSQHGFKRVMTKMTKHGWGDAFYVRTAE
jgi:FkbM family methyltransferase